MATAAAGAAEEERKPETMYIFTGPNRPTSAVRTSRRPGAGADPSMTVARTSATTTSRSIVLEEPINDVAIAPVRLDSDITVVLGGDTSDWLGRHGVDDRVRTFASSGAVSRCVLGRSRQEGEAARPAERVRGRRVDPLGRQRRPCRGQSPVRSSGCRLARRQQRAARSERPGEELRRVPNLYTKLSPFKDVILGAYEAAEAEPWLEGQCLIRASPRRAPPAADGSECRSNLCLSDPGSRQARSTCAQDCSRIECLEGQGPHGRGMT